MAWTKTSGGKLNNGEYSIYSETLSLSLAVNSSPSNWTSVIDFIPPGCDFTVIANSAAANTSASTGVQLFVSYERGAAIGSRYQSKVTPFISDTTQIDTATLLLHRDVSVAGTGQYPYYWLKCPGGGGVDVTFKVIVGKGQSLVTIS